MCCARDAPRFVDGAERAAGESRRSDRARRAGRIRRGASGSGRPPRPRCKYDGGNDLLNFRARPAEGAPRRCGTAGRGHGGLRAKNNSGPHGWRRRRTLLPQAGARRLCAERRQRPDSGSRECAINAPDHPRWDAATRAFVDELSDSGAAPNLETRWLSSVVADAFRIVVRGGDSGRRRRAAGRTRKRRRPSHLRGAPARAPGRAGGREGLDRKNPDSRSESDRAPRPDADDPRLIGDGAEDRAPLCAPRNLADVSPLFGRRGLFRA